MEKHKRYFKYLLILLMFLFVYSFSFLLEPDLHYWDSYQFYSAFDWFVEVILMLAFCWAVVEAGVRVNYLLEKKIPWLAFPLGRFTIQIVVIILISSILMSIQFLIDYLIYHSAPFTSMEWMDNWQWFVINVLVAVWVSIIQAGYYFLEKWRISLEEVAESRIKTLEYKEIALQAELQSLKMQLDPHFMFNNFSTLSELIQLNTDTAILFLSNLSKVYRYMIQNQKKDLILFKDELALAEAYCYLIKMRYDYVQINIKPAIYTIERKYLPPLSMQLLIENAIKHNIASASQPLNIDIDLLPDKDFLFVRNNLQRIPHSLIGTKIGLQNIKDRYKILSNSNLPRIEETKTSFCVYLPLLNLNL